MSDFRGWWTVGNEISSWKRPGFSCTSLRHAPHCTTSIHWEIPWSWRLSGCYVEIGQINTDQWQWIQQDPTENDIPGRARNENVPGTDEFSCQVHARYLPGEAEARNKKALKKIGGRQNLRQPSSDILRYQDVSRIYVNCIELHIIANMSWEVTRQCRCSLPNYMMDEYNDYNDSFLVFSIQHVFWR